MGEPSMRPCSMCGLGPTRVETIRRHVGLVFMQRFVKLEQPLCRTHGMSTTGAFLGRTVVQGWWGLISFFVNWFVVANDVLVLFRYRSLPDPSTTAAVEPAAVAPPATGPPQVSAAPPAASVVPPGAHSVTPGWYPDPAGRFEHRWHDGQNWTRAAARGGQPYDDPLSG